MFPSISEPEGSHKTEIFMHAISKTKGWLAGAGSGALSHTLNLLQIQRSDLDLREQVPAQAQQRDGHGYKHGDIRHQPEMRAADQRPAQPVDPV